MSEGGLRIRSHRCSRCTQLLQPQAGPSVRPKAYTASCLCLMAVAQTRDLFLVFDSEVRSVKSWSSRSKSHHLPFYYSYQYFTLDGLQQLKLDIDRLLHHIRKSFVKQIKDLMECCCFLFCIHSILLYTDVKCHVELEQPKLLTKVASVACSGDADKVKSSESKGVG
jgi:hypothetical protein